MASYDIGPIRPHIPGETRLSSVRTPAAAPTEPRKQVTSGIVMSETLDVGEAPVDKGRVAEIRKALADGTYSIEPRKIADAMMAFGITNGMTGTEQ